jgi:hypothetical protein
MLECNEKLRESIYQVSYESSGGASSAAIQRKKAMLLAIGILLFPYNVRCKRIFWFD